MVDGVTDAVENQADAGRDATLGDRIKMAAGDSAGLVSDNVDNPYVSVIILPYLCHREKIIQQKICSYQYYFTSVATTARPTNVYLDINL